MSTTAMRELSSEQKIQEVEYAFPYHYIPRYEGGRFSHVRKWRWGYEYLAYIRFVLSRLDALEFDSLLDVGCGDGRFLYEACGRYPGKRLTGIDYSERSIQYAQAFNAPAEYVCGDISNGAAIGGRFDVVTLIETLEHIPPPDIPAFIAGIHSRLAPTGRLVLTVPSKNLKLNRKHYQHFDLDSLKSTLAPHFEVSEHYFINKISKWVSVLETVLENRLFILNERRLLSALYRGYEDHLLKAREGNAKRICAVCKPTPAPSAG